MTQSGCMKVVLSLDCSLLKVHTCEECIEPHEGDRASNTMLLDPVKNVPYMILYVENQCRHKNSCH